MTTHRSRKLDVPSTGNDTSPLRNLPSVHELVESPALTEWSGRIPRPWLVEAARQVLEQVRDDLTNTKAAAPPLDELARRITSELERQQKPQLRSVVNATGVILHTGLGRAPLAESARAAIADVAGQYANLEIELVTGQRGQRSDVAADLLCKLTGAEAATVVNNNAAATLITLAALAGPLSQRPRHVIVSRGELIEIGGSFRLPRIMAASGAVLREVGTTNKTLLADYEQAIDIDTAALMKVHTSNYRIEGFTESVAIRPLVELGRTHELPVIHDIGSGAMHDLAPLGLEDEPVAADSVAAGSDLVLFSADKLLGGPQAGLIVGKSKWIASIQRHPLMRAMRVDKLTLAALEATLYLHRDPDRAIRDLPVLAMASAPLRDLQQRAEQISDALQSLDSTCDVQIQPATAYLGGGSMPTKGIDSIAVRLNVSHISEAELARRLRAADPPVIPRVQEGAVWIDLRTVLPQQDQILIAAITRACAAHRP